MDDAILALENSLREGTLDQEALEELKRTKDPQPSFFDKYCEETPWEKECLIYEC